MANWIPTTSEIVQALLKQEVRDLHPEHACHFEDMRVPLRSVPVGDSVWGSVFVVAEHHGKILHWSDIDEGWELEEPTSNGGIPNRGCSQFELKHIMFQLFGNPDVGE